MTADASDYKFWHEELADPGCNARDTDRTDLCGFYRLAGARTKPDFPVAIWMGDETIVCAVGRKNPFAYGSQEFDEFIGSGWTKCIAIVEDAYHAALADGVWADDGKPSNNDVRVDDDVIPETPADEGGNSAPFHELLEEKLVGLAKQAKAFFGKIDSVAKADEATKISEKLKKLWEQGEDKRKAEKKPLDDAVKAVQDKWNPILKPGKDVRDRLEADLQAFLRAEQRRRDDEARADAKRVADENARIEAERKRIADENVKREEENARRLDEAIASGEKVDEVELEEVAPLPELKAAPVAERVLVGSAHGRRTGARKVKRAVIEDYDKLYEAMKRTTWMMAFVEEQAQRIAKAPTGVALDGMRIEEI